MRRISRPSDFVFQVSWEVCNKVGGIYTVLSTQAKALGQIYKDNLIYIGPDLNPSDENPLFEVDDEMFGDFSKKAAKEGLPVRFGRWAVPGRPRVAMVDFRPLFSQKDRIYADMWNWFGVDSLHAYGDYDEACLFALQAGRLIVMLHEWLDGEKGSKTTAVVQA
ncbi:MAG: glycosyl transferase, partial [Bacteroidaceae bacterium]